MLTHTAQTVDRVAKTTDCYSTSPMHDTVTPHHTNPT